MLRTARNLVNNTTPFLRNNSKNRPMLRSYALPKEANNGIQQYRFASLTGTNQNGHSSQPRILRKLGKLEHLILGANRDKGWFNIAQYIEVRSEKELKPEQIKRAFKKLQQRYVSLRTAVVSKDGNKYFAEVPNDPDFEELDTTDEKAVLARIRLHKFQEGELLWKAGVLQPHQTTDEGFFYKFVFNLQHSIVDGLSLHAGIHQTLVDYLEHSLDGNDVGDVESIPLLPPCEDLLECVDMPLEDKINDHASDAAYLDDLTLAKKLYNLERPEYPKYSCEKRVLVYDKTQTSHLIKLSKQNNSSLNSLLVTTAAVATYRFLRELGIITEQKVVLRVPQTASLRRYHTPAYPTEHLAYMVNAFSQYVAVDASLLEGTNRTAFWELAASVKKDIKSMLSTGEPLIDMKRLINNQYSYFVSDPDALFSAAEPVSGLFEVSHYGDHNITSRKGTVTVVSGKLQENLVEPVFFNHMLSTWHGKLQYELTYNKNLASDELHRMYLSIVQEELQKCF